MQVPVRLLQAARLNVKPAVLIAMASSTAVFTATPFVLGPISDEFDVSVGAAGWMSTAQLAGFVIASWAAGRFLRPVRSVFITIGLLGLVANLSSAMAPNLAVMGGTRLVSGVSLGLAAWFGWQDAFGDTQKTGDMAVVGPLVGVILAPGVAIVLDAAGLRWLFVVLAFVAASPLAFAHQISKVDRLRPHQTRHAPTRAARVILASLGMVTLGGSSVFVFAAAIGTDLVGFSAVTVSLVFSGNALAAIPAAKWVGRRGPAGLWFGCTAALAFLLPTIHVKPVFVFALVGWGFAFVMGIPAAFNLLASRSNFPQERAGDAQAVMAAGRVFGPIMGGTFIAAGQTTMMGLAAATVMTTAALLLLYVDRTHVKALMTA
ncbi:MFS transporter [Ilumatobacter coccineus]|uniref:Putative major facilitator superfamily transporter n=1 Tax=Ilumatobacter coccineus (strain NBRC 103263 / KCTC 29153 / YM16-304) TaxID=1313172 RepID=A0A6C7DY23_ILUCY|nr:MFS transporter [Ilumatobacter coccineus]BAN01234.1 putative major facilitator superfamily transporter [Ilumatobacter coccineus YM16-304]